MSPTDFEQLLLSEDDLDESFFGEEPSAAYNPAFISGDESGRVIMDFINMLTHGTHPETKQHASALFTNPMGFVVFHNVTQFGSQATGQVYQEFVTALHDCSAYRMELNDGVQFDVTKVGLEPFDEDGDGVIVHWLTTADPYRIEGSWALVRKDDVLSLINTRAPDKSEIRRLAQISLDRIS
jgi:hypothetical protein